MGSPPHTRGKEVKCDFHFSVLGITPAHAGKRQLPASRRQGWRDHPRTRGEKQRNLDSIVTSTGSPPHTRGKDHPKFFQGQRTGITPAHAGKSHRPDHSRLPSWDHPRTRGEKSSFNHTSPVLKGSPPHTRGKVPVALGLYPAPGITPAHAGKSSWPPGFLRPCRDHPRTRGEKKKEKPQGLVEVGSPPHTRGKALTPSVYVTCHGITPAHAGKSFRALPGDPGGQDHPRTRGEKPLAL